MYNLIKNLEVNGLQRSASAINKIIRKKLDKSSSMRFISVQTGFSQLSAAVVALQVLWSNTLVVFARQNCVAVKQSITARFVFK